MARTSSLSVAFILALIPLLCCGARTAMAHAVHVRSSPRHGEVLTSTPLLIEIWFDQPLFPRDGENVIEIWRDGHPLNVLEGTVDRTDRTRLAAGIPAVLAPGNYEVRWRTLSGTDGDVAAGLFAFAIDPSGEHRDFPPSETTSHATSTAAAQGTVSTTMEADTNQSSIESNHRGRVFWETRVGAILVALLGVAALVWALRQRN